MKIAQRGSDMASNFQRIVSSAAGIKLMADSLNSIPHRLTFKQSGNSFTLTGSNNRAEETRPIAGTRRERTMRNYILLDGSKYKTNSKTGSRPKRVRASSGDCSPLRDVTSASIPSLPGRERYLSTPFRKMASGHLPHWSHSAQEIRAHDGGSRGTSRSVTSLRLSGRFHHPDWEGADNEFHIEVEINTL